mgnify:CR=1 FL=1
MAGDKYKTMVSKSSWCISKSNMLTGLCIKYNNLYTLLVASWKESLNTSKICQNQCCGVDDSHTLHKQGWVLSYIVNLQHTEFDF